MSTPENHDALLAHTTVIVSSMNGTYYKYGNIRDTIGEVYETLAALGKPEPEPVATRPEPAVPVKKSVRPDYIVCLEDGAKLKMLKRYLATRFGMSPDEYRVKWGLPNDYPMVAPNYAARRAELAKLIGLGTKPGQPRKESVPAEKRPVGRPRKAA